MASRVPGRTANGSWPGGNRITGHVLNLRAPVASSALDGQVIAVQDNKQRLGSV
jgi:hypothetical protein